MREDSREARIGRCGEILASCLWQQVGFAHIDIAAAAIRGAPLVNTWEGSFVAADGIMIRRGTFLHEIKTKQQSDSSRGGPRDVRWIPNGARFHCIEAPNDRAYRQQWRRTGLPFVLSIICIDDAELLAATLWRLGEPYPSLQPVRYNVVNYPVDRFARVWQFDPKRLAAFFREDPRKLSHARMRLFLEWLRPRQTEFGFLVRDLVGQLEDQWLTDDRQREMEE